MIIKEKELELKSFNNLRGGDGTVKMQYLIQGDLLKDKCNLFSKIAIPVGGSIGLHDHTTDFEVYYILSGKGQVNDNGEIKEVNVGDVIYTSDGQKHDIKNIGNDELVFIAVVIKE